MGQVPRFAGLPATKFPLTLRQDKCAAPILAQMHNAPVAALPKTLAPDIARRVIRIQALTLIWMTVEAVVGRTSSENLPNCFD